MLKTSLTSEDIKFFYNILYLYEKEKRHIKGYIYKNVPSEIKKKVSLIHDISKNGIELNDTKTPNTLYFKEKEVCVPLLKHLRHSLAHACIEREGEYFVINPQINPKCKICGKVKRKNLMNLIDAILATKKEQ